MKFIDFDREYTSIVYKSEAGNISSGEYVERGEELLNKVKAEAYQQGRSDAIDEFKNSLINWKTTDEEYKSFEDVVEEIAEQLKEQKDENQV